MKKVYLMAILSALLCGGLLYLYLGSLESRTAAAEKANQAPPVEMTDVVVAVTDIPPMTEITEEMVVIESMPAEYVSENTAVSLDQVVGLMADGTIVCGQTIMASAVGSAQDITKGLAAEIPQGMRAMTFSIDTSAGVGGYVEEGNRVDLLYFIAGDPDAGIPGECGIGAEYALVLKAGDIDFDSEDGGIYSSITLAVTQAQSVRLFEIMETGDIYFTLYPAESGGEQ